MPDDDAQFRLGKQIGRLVEGQENLERLLTKYHEDLVKRAEDVESRVGKLEETETHRKGMLAAIAAVVGAGGAAGWGMIRSWFGG